MDHLGAIYICLFCITGSQNIYEGNLKLIMGLIWTLIQHYQIMRRSKFKGIVSEYKE